MICKRCGQERPPVGRCPNCGAPASQAIPRYDDGGLPPSGRVSRPQTSRPVGDDPSRSRVSRPNWDDPRSGSGRGDPGQSYARGPGQSYGRDSGRSYGGRGGPGQSYARGGYDDYDDRGLMVSPGAGGLMPAMDDAALPALPTEDEERALGIRRPAFIPATEERKGAKPTGIRVVSGALTIMLLCAGMLGVSGFLVTHNLAPSFTQLFHIGSPPNIKSAGFTLPPGYLGATPLVTPGPTTTPIKSVQAYGFVTQQTSNAVPKPENPANVFALGSTVYIVGDTTSNVKHGDIFSIHWFYNNIDITDSIQKLKKDCCSIAVTQDDQEVELLFQLTSSITGLYKGEVMYNGKLAYTVLFAVATQSQLATPTAAPTKSGTPAPTPSHGTGTPAATPSALHRGSAYDGA
jgi:hypothetical protein